MANSFFRFKQFTVQQDKCAMKVCTDACLFGAFISTLVVSRQGVQKVLDIGAGTGLLSLMLAQKIPDAVIDAVEIDSAAAQQAKENFEASQWKERLKTHATPIQHFKTQGRFDLIICNPPFFENDLKSEDEKRNVALHSHALTFKDLLTSAEKHLAPEGTFAVLLPYHRLVEFEELSKQYNFFVDEKVLVKQTPKHNNFRSILCLTKKETVATQSQIIIRDEKETYTKEFIALLKDFYLYL
jgi:tRNA1Val (adenine37-N6)-methyltransferase